MKAYIILGNDGRFVHASRHSRSINFWTRNIKEAFLSFKKNTCSQIINTFNIKDKAKVLEVLDETGDIAETIVRLSD